MNRNRSVHHLLHTALLLLVLCGAGQVHNHVCLDGQEPADLVHFENLGGHPEHEDDASHADVESELMPQVLLTKTPGQDSSLYLLSVSLLLTEAVSIQRPYYVVIDDPHFHHETANLTPPLRGPPTYSV